MTSQASSAVVTGMSGDRYEIEARGADGIEIELNGAEPIFLKGRLKNARLAVFPEGVVKNPEGALYRASITQSALLKDRKGKQDQSEVFPEAGGDSLSEGVVTELHDLSLCLDEAPELKDRAFNKDVHLLSQKNSLSVKEQRERLPIYQHREQLLDAIKTHQILIVVGDSECGKTTQIPQYLAEVGYSSTGKIGCTQTHRATAISLAKQLAYLYGCQLGQEVGYAIRFEDCTSPATKIKYMTDGVLLRECLVDPDLSAYSVILIDEAHERTVNTDVLLGLLKGVVKRRPQLKVIVISAPVGAEECSKFFWDSPVFQIPGRVFPVECLYCGVPEVDYLSAALVTVMQIHLSEAPGDILVFLPGKEEVDIVCQVLKERMRAFDQLPRLIILTAYSALPSSQMQFEVTPTSTGNSTAVRKVLIVTDLPEPPFNTDHIRYVVDPGFVKQNVYNPKTGTDALLVCPIAKSQAKERASRAGRTAPGKSYRLYTESAYKNEMLDMPVPEIRRTSLLNCVLTLKALGINDLSNFDFMDKPAESSLICAMYQLYSLGALDDEGLLTTLGGKMAELPLDPPLAKMLLASVQLGCSEEVITIVAMLSVSNIFDMPKGTESSLLAANSKKASFFQPEEEEGDHLTLLAVYEAWKRSGYSNSWCHDNAISARALQRSQDVRLQLRLTMDRCKLEVVSCGQHYSKVRKSIVAGFFAKAAKKQQQKEEGEVRYKTLVDGTTVYIPAGSVLFRKNPDWVVYHELVENSIKVYMHEVTTIEPNWLIEFAASFYKLS